MSANVTDVYGVVHVPRKTGNNVTINKGSLQAVSYYNIEK